MHRTSFRKGIPFFRNQKLYLVFSTVALMCLSLSKELRVTAAFEIMWFLCCLFTTRKEQDGTNPSTCARIISSLIMIVLALNFFYAFSSGKPLNLLVSLGIPGFIVPPAVLFLSVLGSLAGYHALYVYAQHIINLLLPVVDVVKKMYKQYIVLSVIYLFSLTAIIRANFYYVDDLGRALNGYSLEGSFSRFFASFSATLIHGNGWLTDISPLPQFLAAMIMALAAVITLYTISERSDFRILDVICMVPFGIFPYFLQCLSYKYDAPYMALSVLAAVIPLLMRQHSASKYIISAAVGTIIVCTTYQVSAGIFPMCVAFLCFTRWNNGEKVTDILPFLWKSVIGYAAGLLFFRIILMEPISEGDYVSASINLRTFPDNICEYAQRILEDFNLVWLVLFALVFFGFIVTACVTTKRTKCSTLLMCLFTLFVVFVLSYGLYSVFTEPLTSPRSMYGFGILLALLSCYTVSNTKSLLSHTSICLLAWLVFIFSFTYGNALSSQKDYANFRMEQVWTDLSQQKIADARDIKQLSVTGTIGFSPSVRNMLSSYPVLEDLIPIALTDSTSYWGTFQLTNYYGIDTLVRDPFQDIPPSSEMILLTDSLYHTIYGNKNYILIELK